MIEHISDSKVKSMEEYNREVHKICFILQFAKTTHIMVKIEDIVYYLSR